MSTTTLTDLNHDCLLLIAEELVDFEAIDSDFGAACKDLVSQGATCRSIRSTLYSDEYTFGGFRKEVFQDVQLKSNKKEKIGSLFTFLHNVNTVVESLSLPEMRMSCVYMKRGECQALRDAGDRVPLVSERMDSLCKMCPTLPNLQRIEIGDLRTDVFGPRMPNLTRFTASKATDGSSCQNISRSWPALKEVRMEQYVGLSQGLKTFLTGQNHLVAFELIATYRSYRGALHAWLGTPSAATRVTTLTLMAYGLTDTTLINRIALCRNLERLEVYGNDLTDAALPPIGQLAHLSHLRLAVTCGITTSGFAKFFENATFSLRSVDLDLWWFSGPDILIALISHNPELEEVVLLGNRTSDDGDAFKDINSLHRLRVFKYFGTGLGRDFLDRLDPGALTHLERVVANDGEWFNQDRVDRFKTRFPSCRFE